MEKLTSKEIFAFACRDAWLIKTGSPTQAFFELCALLNSSDKETIRKLSDRLLIFPAEMLREWSHV